MHRIGNGYAGLKRFLMLMNYPALMTDFHVVQKTVHAFQEHYLGFFCPTPVTTLLTKLFRRKKLRKNPVGALKLGISKYMSGNNDAAFLRIDLSLTFSVLSRFSFTKSSRALLTMDISTHPSGYVFVCEFVCFSISLL